MFDLQGGEEKIETEQNVDYHKAPVLSEKQFGVVRDFESELVMDEDDQRYM